MTPLTYLDSAATTFLKPASVGRAVAVALRTCSSPGRGGYVYAMAAAETLYRCRERAARLLGAPNVENVVMTFNATHGLNIAIRSLVRPGDRVVISGYEHNSVLRPLHALGADIRVACSPLFDRAAALDAFDRLVDGSVRAVVINHVSNVFGFVLPVREVSELCRARGVPLIVDASQSAGVLEVDASGWGADFVAMPGHKGLYGPQGTGILIASERALPLICGGTGSDSRSPDMPAYLPDRLEAGTHNMPGIAGLDAGLAFVERTGTARIAAHERRLIGSLAERLRAVPGVRLFAAPDMSCQTGVLSFDTASLAPEEAGERLGEMGFAVRAGLHCAPLAHRTVGTLPRGTVRVSVCAFTTENDITAFARAVERLCAGTK